MVCSSVSRVRIVPKQPRWLFIGALTLLIAACPIDTALAQQPSTSDPAYVAADTAYKAFDRRDYPTAVTQAREAVRLAPQNRDYRLLLINALMGNKQFRDAEIVMSTVLAGGDDPELYAQRGYLRLRLGNKSGAAADLAAAAHNSDPSSAKGRALRLSLFDASLAAGMPQQALSALTPYAGERSYEILSRRGFALLALKRLGPALDAFVDAAHRTNKRSERAAMTRAYIGVLIDLGRKDEARLRFAQAIDAGLLQGSPDLDVAYLALRVGDDMTAIHYFSRAKAKGELKGAANFDAGYAAKRVARNTEAIEFFKAGIDADATARVPRPPQYIYGVRREVAELERVWGVNASLSYGGVGIVPVAAGTTPPPTGSVAQIGGEVYWRPPGIGNRNGATVEVFARAFETIYDESGGVTGSETIQGTVGARWKPLSAINLVFEGGRMIKVGDLSRNDWLLRVAYSTGDGLDLRVDRTHWFTWQVYAEYDRFLEVAQNVALFEGRIGESFLIASNLVLTPHGALIARYDNTLATPETLGIGPGLTLRKWFREDTYAAPRSYVEGVLQYRFRISGDDRVKGLFAGVNLLY